MSAATRSSGSSVNPSTTAVPPPGISSVERTAPVSVTVQPVSSASCVRRVSVRIETRVSSGRAVASSCQEPVVLARPPRSVIDMWVLPPGAASCGATFRCATLLSNRTRRPCGTGPLRVAVMAGSGAPCTTATRHSWSAICGVHASGPTRTAPPAGIGWSITRVPSDRKCVGQSIPVPGSHRNASTWNAPLAASWVPRLCTRT